jgi:hypothetical protein
MGKRVDNEFIIILDIDKVFSSDEVAMVQEAGNYKCPIKEEKNKK